MAHIHLAEKQLSTEVPCSWDTLPVGVPCRANVVPPWVRAQDYLKAQKDYDPDGKPVSIDIAEAQVSREGGGALKRRGPATDRPVCMNAGASRRREGPCVRGGLPRAHAEA
jgi:hypothetical protein